MPDVSFLRNSKLNGDEEYSFLLRLASSFLCTSRSSPIVNVSRPVNSHKDQVRILSHIDGKECLEHSAGKCHVLSSRESRQRQSYTHGRTISNSRCYGALYRREERLADVLFSDGRHARTRLYRIRSWYIEDTFSSDATFSSRSFTDRSTSSLSNCIRERDQSDPPYREVLI